MYVTALFCIFGALFALCMILAAIAYKFYTTDYRVEVSLNPTIQVDTHSPEMKTPIPFEVVEATPIRHQTAKSRALSNP